MVRENEIREAEVAVTLPATTDAGLIFIGRIHTPWESRLKTPRQGRQDGPLCRIEVFNPWADALNGLEQFERVEVLYWLHLSRRDLVMQSPANDGTAHGTFSLRSPARGSVLASDAFFPFADGLEAAIAAGVTAAIQPGGSRRDDEVIAAADAAGIAMVFTGLRHFRH